MQVFIPAEKVALQNVFFVDKKKNVVIDGHFIKILYSNEHMEINGLYVSFHPFTTTNNHAQPVSDSRRVALVGNTKSSTKYLVEFNPYHSENMTIISRLYYLERTIINQYISMHAPNKTAVFNLRNQLMTGTIKIQSANEPFASVSLSPSPSPSLSSFAPAMPNYALKISGVWETNTSVGITVKFITVGY